MPATHPSVRRITVGVDFDRTLAAVSIDAVLEGIEIELVVLSSGYAEIIEGSGIMEAFDALYASTFHFREDGEAGGANALERAGERVDDYYDRHVRFDRMIYLGDGASDLQAFGFPTGRGGLAIAIDKDDRFDDAEDQTPAQRVDNLAPPSYAEGGELLETPRHAVRACASRIALRSLSRGE